MATTKYHEQTNKHVEEEIEYLNAPPCYYAANYSTINAIMGIWILHKLPCLLLWRNCYWNRLSDDHWLLNYNSRWLLNHHWLMHRLSHLHAWWWYLINLLELLWRRDIHLHIHLHVLSRGSNLLYLWLLLRHLLHWSLYILWHHILLWYLLWHYRKLIRVLWLGRIH